MLQNARSLEHCVIACGGVLKISCSFTSLHSNCAPLGPGKEEVCVQLAEVSPNEEDAGLVHGSAEQQNQRTNHLRNDCRDPPSFQDANTLCVEEPHTAPFQFAPRSPPGTNSPASRRIWDTAWDHCRQFLSQQALQQDGFFLSFSAWLAVCYFE